MSKEVGTLFTAPMIRACIEGRKDVTRRTIRGQDEAIFVGAVGDDKSDPRNWGWYADDGEVCTLADGGEGETFYRPRWQPGDIMVARETWARSINNILFRADYPDGTGPQDNTDEWDWYPHQPNVWKSPLHLPFKDSRYRRLITSVRVERLQDITEEDAIREGVVGEEYLEAEERFANTMPGGASGRPTPRGWYAELWELINGPGSWALNPWIVRIEWDKKELAVKA